MSESPAPATWQGKTVRLRAADPTDWAAFFANDNDTDAARNGWEIPLPQSMARARAWAEEKSARQPSPHDDSWYWVIADSEGSPIGSINTHGCDRRNGNFEYGIAVFREHWGKGYGPAALELMLRFMFAERRYHKCNSYVYAFNERSLRMHEKFGFVPEGRVRDQIFTAGRYHDSVTLGITAPEFFARYGR